MIVAGIDIGGTGTKIALVDAQGTILARTAIPTDPGRGPEDTLRRIVAAVRGLAAGEGRQIAGLGVGVTGPVDPLSGVVDNPYTLGGWPPTDLKTPLGEALQVPVAVDNDANVAALGEAWLGAGRGFRRVVMVTVGTGVGVAAVLDGVVQRSVDGRHGEAGHMPIDPEGPECYCGGRGCLEVLASGTALDRRTADLARRGEGVVSRLAGGDPGKAGARLLFEAAAAGDAAAGAEVERAARWLGLGLVTLAATLTPDVFVMAGGVSRNLGALLPGIRDELHRRRAMIPSDVPVLAARLGDDAGPVGAARLAIEAVRDGGTGA